MLSHGQCTALSQVWLYQKNTWIHVCPCTMPNYFFSCKKNKLLPYVVMLPELLCSQETTCGCYFAMYIPVLLFLKIDIEDLFTCVLNRLSYIWKNFNRCQAWFLTYERQFLCLCSYASHRSTVYLRENICFFLRLCQVYLRANQWILCYSNGIIIYIIFIIYEELFVQLNVPFVRVKTTERQLIGSKPVQ